MIYKLIYDDMERRYIGYQTNTEIVLFTSNRKGQRTGVQRYDYVGVI